MYTAGYDNWKLETPINFESEVMELDVCENCGKETESIIMAGKVDCCKHCFGIVLDKQLKVQELFEPVWKLRAETLKSRKGIDSKFIPMEQTLRYIRKELATQYAIKKEKVRITELNEDECNCVIEILEGIYNNSKILKGAS